MSDKIKYLEESGKKTEKNKNQPEKEPTPPPSPSNEELYESLSPIQREIIDLLSKEGTLHGDVIAQQLKIAPSELVFELTELEILGAVNSLPGKMFEKV